MMGDGEGNLIPVPPELCNTCFHARKHHSVYGGATNYYCLNPGCQCQDETANYPSGMCSNCSRAYDDHKELEHHLICPSPRS